MAEQEDFLRQFLRCEADLRALVGAAVRDVHVREDVFQEIALTLWQHFGRYDPSRPFRAWARGVAAKKLLERSVPGVLGALELTSEQKQKLGAAVDETIQSEKVRAAVVLAKLNPNATQARKDEAQKLVAEARGKLQQLVAQILTDEQKKLVADINGAAEQARREVSESLKAEQAPDKHDEIEVLMPGNVATMLGRPIEYDPADGTCPGDDIVHQGRVLKQIDVDPATDIRCNEKITVPKSGWLAVRCLGRSDNPNLSPVFAFAHTSPFYVLVDGQPIRSPEDARYFHDYLSESVKRSLPRVKNEQIRRILEAKCRDALAKYAAQAELQEAESAALAARSGPDQRKE